LDQPTEPDDDSASLNLANVAMIEYSSEDAAHPVEHPIDEPTGPGGSCWAAAQADTTEQLVLEFDRPESIGRLVCEVQEVERERMQEVHVEASTDAGRSYHRVVVQEYTFSPGGATLEHEDLRLDSTTSRTCGSPSSPTSAGWAWLPSPHVACSPDPPHQANVPAL